MVVEDIHLHEFIKILNCFKLLINVKDKQPQGTENHHENEMKTF